MNLKSNIHRFLLEIDPKTYESIFENPIQYLKSRINPTDFLEFF